MAKQHTARGADDEAQVLGTNPEETAGGTQQVATVDKAKELTEEQLEIADALESLELADHIRQGLMDPSPSVRAMFRKHLAKAEQTPKERTQAYRGPFVVQHPFMVSGAHLGDDTLEDYADKRMAKRVRMSHLMPAPDGSYVPRILNQGDLPDDMMQALWADGVLKPYEPPRPKPAVRPASRAMPQFR